MKPPKELIGALADARGWIRDAENMVRKPDLLDALDSIRLAKRDLDKAEGMIRAERSRVMCGN